MLEGVYRLFVTVCSVQDMCKISGCCEHLLSCAVEHMGICSVMQHVDAVGDFTVMFVLDLGKQLFKHLTVTVYIDCVTT